MISIYIRDIILGANDGIITTFAIVAGAIGAGFSAEVIIVLGVANLLADGISMASSNFLGLRSEVKHFLKKRKEERISVKKIPEKEKEEIRAIFLDKKFSPEEAGKLTEAISSNEDFWIDFMMRYELGMKIPERGNEWRAATFTFFSFAIAGALPLLPFIFYNADPNSFIFSIVATALALFMVGAARSFVTHVNWALSGLEMLFIGGFAATAAYLVGYFVGIIV